MQERVNARASATAAIFLWGVVAAGLTYGVVNTIRSVIDLFAG